jgi:isopenicillin N synthase-like dioxygenase
LDEKETNMTVLQTFELPAQVTGTATDVTLGQELIRAWRADGIFQIATDDKQDGTTQAAIAASQRFFKEPQTFKSRCISDLTYSGYIASGEEVTAGQADYSEIFTICKDLPESDPRVQNGWPCHGPVPWPDSVYHKRMKAFMDELGAAGEKLLKLTALGMNLPISTFTDLTRDGWHHMRVLRFPTKTSKSSRGIGAHTDYGLLVIAAQDDVGGLYIRPPVEGEKRNRNWLPEESSAGLFEHEEPWTFVTPTPRVWTVFPGDIMQFMTNGYLLSTPHKVKLNTRERFACAYFHEPGFEASARPLFEPDSQECIHYGEHFTNMFMRCYPDRITTRRIHKESRLEHLEELKTRDRRTPRYASNP